MPARMEKLYVNASFLCSKALYGIGRYGLDMCKGLRDCLGDAVIFLVPPSWDYSNEGIKLGLTIVGKTRTRAIWEQIDLPLWLAWKGFPLLISFSNTGPFLYRNQIYTIHDIFFKTSNSFLKNHRQHYSALFTYYANLSYAILLKRAKRVIANSEYTKTEVCRNYAISAGKIDVVYPYLDDQFFKSNEDTPNKHRTYIVGVSSLRPNKNFDGLIKANLPANVQLLIVGGEESLIKEYSLPELSIGQNIQFTGYISDSELISIYQHALFLVYPSFFEGFGIPPIEAMACGCPTILSNVTSLPEVGGNATIYVNPHDTDAIGEAIRNLYYNDTLRAELIQKGYERVRLFNRETSMRALLRTIERASAEIRSAST